MSNWFREIAKKVCIPTIFISLAINNLCYEPCENIPLCEKVRPHVSLNSLVPNFVKCLFELLRGVSMSASHAGEKYTVETHCGVSTSLDII